jgi:hypothetical protein
MSTVAQKNGKWSANVKVGAGLVMVRIGPIRVTSFLLLAACGALCQQSQEKAEWSSLPDAPSVQASAQAETLRRFPDGAGSTLAVGADRGVTRESNLTSAARPAQPGFTVLYNAKPVQNEPNDFFGKYLYPSLLKRNLNYHPSASSSFMGRATYAASRVFVTRDESGKGRLNSSYFLGVLTSVAVHTAYRPYWARSSGVPFNDLGSTIGNDAGMNLFHEFRPGIQQLMKSHAPKLVSRIEERIGRN